MKKLLLSLALVMMSASLFGQTTYSYEYGNQTITLTEDGTYTYFIQNSIGQVEGVFSFYLNLYTFYSLRYNCSNGSKAIILPRIIFKLPSGVSAGDIYTISQDYGTAIGMNAIDTTDKVYVLSLTGCSSSDILNLINALYSLEVIEWAEPEILFDVKLANNNPLFSLQYHLKNTGAYGGFVGMDIDVENAWLMVNDCSGITVAVIDDGVEIGHPDMGNCVLNGFTVGGYSNYGNGEPANETTNNVKGHGTACAGLIAAADNDIGVVGVAPGANILPVNIFPYGDEPERYLAKYPGVSNIRIMEAILDVIDDADIINCSWNIKDPSNAIDYALHKASAEGRNGLGCVVVAAAGNEYDNGNGIADVSFPASIDSVIAVGAISRFGTSQPYSQRGNKLELVAPSGGIPLADGTLYGDIVTIDRSGSMGYEPSSDYVGIFGGTSASCAIVSGVVALMLARNPYLTAAEVRQKLHGATVDLGQSDFDGVFGHGLIRASDAVISAGAGNLNAIDDEEQILASHTNRFIVPAGRNRFIVSLDGSPLSNDKSSLTVRNTLSGQQVLKQNIINYNNMLIDASTWSPGIYVVEVRSERGTRQSKFIVR